VAWAEVSSTYEATASVTPNDLLFPQQWGPVRVRAPEAWGRTTGKSLVVAVLDSGVDASHPDLAGAVLDGADCVSSTVCVPESQGVDQKGHGTEVAGVIAGRGNNGIGVAGYCWSCLIQPVRVLNASGSGQDWMIANGITWAATHGADIINLSLAGSGDSPAMRSAISGALSRGVLVVAAAGNQDETKPNEDLTVPQYPASIPGVIGVVATQQDDTPYSWTFRGPWTDLAGPGCAISTTPSGPGKAAGYAKVCGTSFASPAVAGILALAKAAFPNVANAVLESTLDSTSAPVPSGLTTNGRVDAAAFLDALATLTPVAPTVTRLSGTDPARTSVAVSVSGRSSAPAAVLARAEDFADALTAGPLAVKVRGPLLLTPGASLDGTVLGELRRLKVSTVYLAGGTTALSPAIASTLTSSGITPVRVAGASRYETASAIARLVGGTSVYVASATSWPDAVGVSALAASLGRPIVLTDAAGLPAATATALAGLGVVDATVVGGTAVVSDSVLAALRAKGITTSRLAGTTRYLTSSLVADATLAAGISPSQTWLATGQDWRDALVAGPAAAANSGVLLLIDGGRLDGTSASAWLSARTGGVRDLRIVGTELSVTASVLTLLKTLLG
jgi:subtilisin family serine protease